MNIILAVVSSLDGKLTKGTEGDIYEWSSPEDFSHFQKLKLQFPLIVMGSTTYNQVKDNPKAGLKPESERLRVVLTKNPELYKQYFVPGQLEFVNETPKQLVSLFEKKGFDRMLLASGGKVTTAFFKDKLINEIWITIEPRIFGQGEMLLKDTFCDVQLKLLGFKILNTQGTMLFHYSVIYV